MYNGRCTGSVNFMVFETENAIFESFINVAQIEITGKCNLNCKHCRGNGNKNLKKDMPFDKIKEIINFAKNNSVDGYIEIVLSGGEPLLHPQLENILKFCKQENVLIEITTNGYLINQKFIDMFKENNVTTISISLDSITPQENDKFRGKEGAFDKAINAIKLLNQNDIRTRIRSTISNSNIDEMEKIVLFAIDLNVDNIAFGPIIPVGNAVTLGDEMFNTPEQMKNFIDLFYELKEKYKDKVNVVTNECLHGLHELDEYKTNDDTERMIDGCSAGIVSFNVLINGNMTPCSMYHRKILNIYESNDFAKDYINSPTIKELLERNYVGKCGSCNLKFVCGGCRVRAEFYTGNRLGSDPLCWV